MYFLGELCLKIEDLETSCHRIKDLVISLLQGQRGEAMSFACRLFG